MQYLNPSCLQEIAIGKAPGTGLSVPSSESSPTITQSDSDLNAY